MNKTKILVLIKYSQDEMGFFDQSALECALSTPNAAVTVLSLLPPARKEKLASLTRLGANVIMLSDPVFALSDTYATSHILSRAIEQIDFDCIFTGRQSRDGDTGQVPTMVATLLNLPVFGYVRCEKDGSLFADETKIDLSQKGIYIFDRSLPLRFPSLFSTQKEIEIWDHSKIGISPSLCGLQGSLTKVIRNYENNIGRRFPKDACFSSLSQVIAQSLKKGEGRKKNSDNEKAPIAAYFGNIRDKALEAAEKVIEIKCDPREVEEAIAMIKKSKAKVVLFEDSLPYRMLSSHLAIKLKAGLCADCVSFRVKDGRLILTRPALGGSIMADIVCESEYSLATVKPSNKSSDVVFALGKGAIPYIENIKDLAEKFNADIYASRGVVDLGLLSYERQVGLTGKFIYPKVYVAFGISGAVQHTCGMDGSQTIIAINIDPKARIFSYADYRIVDDIKNLF